MPSEGLFYLGPVPTLRKGVQTFEWMLESRPFEIYEPGTREAFWNDDVAPYLARAWAERLGVEQSALLENLIGLGLGLPHGRVERANPDGWTIVWSDEMPVPEPLILNMVLQDFCLLGEKVVCARTGDGAIISEQRARLAQILRLTEWRQKSGWPNPPAAP